MTVNITECQKSFSTRIFW